MSAMGIYQQLRVIHSRMCTDWNISTASVSVLISGRLRFRHAFGVDVLMLRFASGVILPVAFGVLCAVAPAGHLL